MTLTFKFRYHCHCKSPLLLPWIYVILCIAKIPYCCLNFKIHHYVTNVCYHVIVVIPTDGELVYKQKHVHIRDIFDVVPLTNNMQTVTGCTNLCNKHGDIWTSVILAVDDSHPQ